MEADYVVRLTRKEFETVLDEAVARGIEFLDKYAGRQWHTLLYWNPKYLVHPKARSDSSNLCHLALAFSLREDMKNSRGEVTFASVERHLRDTISFSRKDAIDYGFCLPAVLPEGFAQEDACRMLDKAWEQALKALIAKSPLYEETV